MPKSAAHSSARFWDRIADRYSKKPVADETAYQRKLQLTRDYFRPDMEVLEFGCGTGSTAIAHAPYVGSIRAIDVSSKMIEIARGKSDGQEVGNISFERATIDEFSASDQTFDAVLGLSILHLLADKDAIIAKVHGLLKPGGIFVSSTPCLGGLRYAPLKVLLPIGSLFGLVPRVQFFSIEELRASLTDAGFEIDQQWQPRKGEAVFIVAKKAP